MAQGEFPGYLIQLKNTEEFLNDSGNNFIGREVIRKNLFISLRKSLESRGSFLIGGFRGVGKSLLVQKTLDDLRGKLVSTDSQIGIMQANINLGEAAEISTRDILTDISELLANKYQTYTREVYKNVKILLLALFFATVLSAFISHSNLLMQTKCLYVISGLIVIVILLWVASLVYEKHVLNKVILFCGGLFCLSGFSLIFIAVNSYYGTFFHGLASELITPTKKWQALIFFVDFYKFPLIILFLVLGLFRLSISEMLKVERQFDELLRGVRGETVNEDSKVAASLGMSFGRKQQSKSREMSARRIEQYLSRICHDLSLSRFPITSRYLQRNSFFAKYLTLLIPSGLSSKLRANLRIVIILDELDKVSGFGKSGEGDTTKVRKEMIDAMLGGLKGFITSSRATGLLS